MSRGCPGNKRPEAQPNEPSFRGEWMNARLLLAAASRDFSSPVGFFPIVIIFGGQTPGDPGTGDPHSQVGGASGRANTNWVALFHPGCAQARGVETRGPWSGVGGQARPQGRLAPRVSSSASSRLPLSWSHGASFPWTQVKANRKGASASRDFERMPFRGLMVAGVDLNLDNGPDALLPSNSSYRSHPLVSEELHPPPRCLPLGGGRACRLAPPVATPHSAWRGPPWGCLPLRSPWAMHPGRLQQTSLTASSSETPLFFTRSKSKRCEK